MADDRNQSNTHITNLRGRFRVETSNPTNPVVGDMYFNKATGDLLYYTGNNWIGATLT